MSRGLYKSGIVKRANLEEWSKIHQVGLLDIIILVAGYELTSPKDCGETLRRRRPTRHFVLAAQRRPEQPALTICHFFRVQLNDDATVGETVVLQYNSFLSR